MTPLLALRQLDQCRPWSNITREGRVQIEQNARIRRLVERRRRNASTQLGRPAPRHSEIDALWIRLCTIRLARSVQRDNLVANHVVAWREAGDGQVPVEAGLDEVVGHPCAGVAAGLVGAGLDLGPGEGEGVDGAAVAVAGGYVFLHGADVGGWPCVP